MLIIGRITKDAVISQLKDDRQVVNFSIAVNEWYKPKNGESKQFTTFINCAYWISTKIATALTKGSLVEVNGRIYVNAYSDMKGEARASLNCHVNSIKIHSGIKKNETAASLPNTGVEISEPEDLPF